MKILPACSMAARSSLLCHAQLALIAIPIDGLPFDEIFSIHRWRGSIKIHRLYTDRALLVDTNLLTSVFPRWIALSPRRRAWSPKK
jgi:hypothetical protein